ncbi:hypothetical protein OpiT1DRAFT_05984 [Opitutaceae bacterium TAV1]|nr:hypothetical protein OpiT1DRAFT_05984 [Opitutaceae bacterium TAV1]
MQEEVTKDGNIDEIPWYAWETVYRDGVMDMKQHTVNKDFVPVSPIPATTEAEERVAEALLIRARRVSVSLRSR